MAAIALTLIIAVPIGMGYILNIDDVERNVWKDNESMDVSRLINNSSQMIYTPYTGVDNNNTAENGIGDIQSLDFVSVGSTVTSVPVYSMTGTYNWEVTTGENVPDANFGPVWSFSVTTSQMRSITFAMTDGTYRGVVFDSSPMTYAVVKTASKYVVAVTTEIPADQVSRVIFHFLGSYTIPVTVREVSGYANPSFGWHAPDIDTGYYWKNGQSSNSFLMTVNLASPSVSRIFVQSYPTDTYGAQTAIEIDKQVSGSVIISTYYKAPDINPLELIDSVELGNYQYIRLELDYSNSQLSVSGLAAWPPMNGIPAQYNTSTLEFQKIPGYSTFGYLVFDDPTAANIYRIDRTMIYSGYYPTAENVSIDPTQYYPQISSSKIVISKVGLTGDSITFAGETYPVTNGTITVGSSKHNVDGLVLRSITSDGVTWNNYIDNRQVDDSAAISPVGLGGTWSAIYTLSDLELSTETAPEWIPGGFGIDQDTFALIGLMTCAALTVILGMYGVRSGVKVLWLMMATGGAALIFMFML